jgi:C1A family cysteine protease
MKVLIAIALFATAIVAIGTPLNSAFERKAMESFSSFMKKYNKVYTADEFHVKFENFKQNLMELERRNHQAHNILNVTKFFDMSHAEFRKYPCGVDKLQELDNKRPGFVPQLNTEPVPIVAPLPTNFDWTTKGAVTPVKNQEQCGSCWAFSTIGNVEGVHFLAKKKLVSLSEQQEVACSTTDYGCEGGWPFWALTDMLASPYNGQIDTESGYPYTSGDGENGQCEFGTNDVGARIKSYKSYCTEQTAACNEVTMQSLLITYGPLSVCLDAGPMQYYQGGIDNPTDCDPNAIDHCVTMVGYGVENGTPYWKIKNSWGTDWGESGFYRLIRGTGACGINKVITVASV